MFVAAPMKHIRETRNITIHKRWSERDQNCYHNLSVTTPWLPIPHYMPLTAFFPRTAWASRHQNVKPFQILLEQEMSWWTGWHWHQLDHMHIICTSLQTDNHASTSPLSFYRPDALPSAQPTSSKHWRQSQSVWVNTQYCKWNIVP